MIDPATDRLCTGVLNGIGMSVLFFWLPVLHFVFKVL